MSDEQHHRETVQVLLSRTIRLQTAEALLARALPLLKMLTCMQMSRADAEALIAEIRALGIEEPKP